VIRESTTTQQKAIWDRVYQSMVMLLGHALITRNLLALVSCSMFAVAKAYGVDSGWLIVCLLDFCQHGIHVMV
jgi:hypothetical protein